MFYINYKCYEYVIFIDNLMNYKFVKVIKVIYI